jgi:hypothetical protein
VNEYIQIRINWWLQSWYTRNLLLTTRKMAVMWPLHRLSSVFAYLPIYTAYHIHRVLLVDIWDHSFVDQETMSYLVLPTNNDLICDNCFCSWYFDTEIIVSSGNTGRIVLVWHIL